MSNTMKNYLKKFRKNFFPGVYNFQTVFVKANVLEEIILPIFVAFQFYNNPPPPQLMISVKGFIKDKIPSLPVECLVRKENKCIIWLKSFIRLIFYQTPSLLHI